MRRVEFHLIAAVFLGLSAIIGVLLLAQHHHFPTQPLEGNLADPSPCPAEYPSWTDNGGHACGIGFVMESVGPYAVGGVIGTCYRCTAAVCGDGSCDQQAGEACTCASDCANSMWGNAAQGDFSQYYCGDICTMGSECGGSIPPFCQSEGEPCQGHGWCGGNGFENHTTCACCPGLVCNGNPDDPVSTCQQSEQPSSSSASQLSSLSSSSSQQTSPPACRVEATCMDTCNDDRMGFTSPPGSDGIVHVCLSRSAAARLPGMMAIVEAHERIHAEQYCNWVASGGDPQLMFDSRERCCSLEGAAWRQSCETFAAMGILQVSVATCAATLPNLSCNANGPTDCSPLGTMASSLWQTLMDAPAMRNGQNDICPVQSSSPPHLSSPAFSSSSNSSHGVSSVSSSSSSSHGVSSVSSSSSAFLSVPSSSALSSSSSHPGSSENSRTSSSSLSVSASTSPAASASSRSSVPTGACCLNKECIMEDIPQDICLNTEPGMKFYAEKKCSQVVPQDCHPTTPPASSSQKSSSSRTSSVSSKSCCLCAYQEVMPTTIAFMSCRDAKSEMECTNLVSTLGSKDCRWDNAPDPFKEKSCNAKFYFMCQEWLDSSQCSNAGAKWTVQDKAQMPDTSSCTRLNFIRMGHTFGCKNYTDLISVCLTMCRDLECATFDNAGCSEFQNEQEADAAIQKLTAQFVKEGMQITISGNQTYAPYPQCRNLITYTLTAKKTEKKYDPCYPNAYCLQGSIPITCTDEQGSLAKLLCCPRKPVAPNPPSEIGGWSGTDGRCSQTCTLSKTKDFFTDHDLASFIEEAKRELTRCVEGLRSFCKESGSTSQITDALSVSVSHAANAETAIASIVVTCSLK